MSSKKFKAMPSIGRLKLEAIFHPKFENETPDAEVREKMLGKVASDDGYLEASLKHSGSLLLWSGRQRFYSKNSTNNIFTRVGEIMLMQHFGRCFGSQNWKEEYERCSEYVHRNRLTCSFEVVTSVLGHHGDLPKRDYLILIAVADRGCGRGRFFSTNEIVRFAHKFRLPHNDVWIFCSNAACEALFLSHDIMREIGTATTVINRLDQIVLENEGSKCSKVASLYPHDVFQGDILEGIVIRYIPHETSAGDDAAQNSLSEMKGLSDASNELLKLVPPSLTIDRQTTDEPMESIEQNTIEQLDLRRISLMDNFEQQAENVLQSFHGSKLRQILREDDSVATKSIDMVQIANGILSSNSCRHSINDRETVQIAKLIQTLDELKIHVSYKVLTEQTCSERKEKLLCILQIHNDSSFPRYHAYLRREKNDDGLMLFRGFSIELVPTDDSNANAPESLGWGTSEVDAKSIATEEKLMLKMKFLPYMVRTFICRNGLSILQSSGVAVFENYAISQLSKWKLSDAAVSKWMPFFKGWAKYCTGHLSTSLPPLANGNYLHHYNEYASLFAKGHFQPTPEYESSFQGMVVIVGHSKSDLEVLAIGISKELHCSTIVHDINSITNKDVLLATQRLGGGLICVAEIEDGVKNMRTLAKENQELIFIIMVEGDMFGADDICSRRMKGMTKSWRKSKCNMMLDLSKESAMQPDLDATLLYLRTDESAKFVLEKLKEEAMYNDHEDNGPGLIVYFPSIPGSGKSSLCANITENTLGIGNGRQLILKEGDQVKGKFYSIVGNELLRKQSTVAILDKNVPPASFPSIRALCVESKSIALCILPMGMKDTLIGNGASSHVYPFSLQYLVACMSRVLKRKPGSHKGKLDEATENACMVVVRFYCFYRNMTAAMLKEKLQGYEIVIPFFKENPFPDLPEDLKIQLEDAIMLQTREDMKICKAGASASEMDKRLRLSIRENHDYIENLTISLTESKTVFVSELSRVIASLPDKLESGLLVNESMARIIRIASLDIDYEELHVGIAKLRKSFPELEQYFAKREEHDGNDENDENQNRFITSVHCTLAHASEVPQAYILKAYQHLLGSEVELKATAILFSDKISAIELELSPQLSILRPQNQFPHITLWCAKYTKARESNALPEKIIHGEAKRIVFGHPLVLKGVLSFWYY